jgi:Cu+-exporting ATPase
MTGCRDEADDPSGSGAGDETTRGDVTATGKAAQSGVLFKNAEAIEIMRKVNTLVVDVDG